ncbi:MAG: GAF domain-containing sensor histidine kinase [Chloroflexi bacterium]|nr:GAF domain-containing sensor histidine kinase [Chloroflexota bacterium]
MTKQLPATSREWALFGLRWLPALGLLIEMLTQPGLAERPTLLSLTILAVISNLLVLIFLLLERWTQIYTIGAIVADVAITLGAASTGDLRLAWIGLIPALTAGLYFGWQGGLAASLSTALIYPIVFIISSGLPPPELLPWLLASVIGIAAMGPLVGLLRDDPARVIALEEQERRADQLSKRAVGFLQVVYEMANVLSASRLDPRRVLHSSLMFGLEGLNRVGVASPLYGVVMLFSNEGEDVDVLLRVTQRSNSVGRSDLWVAVPGIAGAIGETVTKSAPAISRSPSSDPELRLFESFSKCGTVLSLPLKMGDEFYGVMLIGAEGEDAFSAGHIELMRAVSNQTAASLHNARLYSDLLDQRDRIVQVEKDARAQLASELHDGPTQGVSAITMRLNYIRKLLEKKPERAAEELYHVEDMARRTTKEIRAMLFELRPKALESGLEPALQQLALRMKETYQQEVAVDFDPRCDDVLDAHTTQTLFSIVLETTNNARKHAKAELITVRSFITNTELVLEVSDNGGGFDVDRAIEDSRKREGHLGLVNLQERATLIEGRLEIQSEIGKGSRTAVYVPLEVIRHRKQEEKRRDVGEDEVDMTPIALNR